MSSAQPDSKWTPISRAELEEIIRAEEPRFLPDRRAMWETYRVPIAPASIVRSEDLGAESVFVVARNGDTALFYDDVEDQFAVGTLGSNNMLTFIGYVGELHYAIAAVDKGDV